MAVRSFAPDGYEAYVRVDHPGVEGELPPDVKRRLSEHLSTYTATPERLLCAAWNVDVWWPEDRAWCVVTETGSQETFVACSSACARALLEDEVLDASTATLIRGDPYPRLHAPTSISHVAPSASWYANGLLPWPEPDGSVRVRSLVPPDFEAYVRIDHPLVEGEIPVDVCWRLGAHLPLHTTTPDRVFYAAWDGRPPATHSQFASMPRLVAPGRTYIVFPGDRDGPRVDVPDDVHDRWPLVVNVWWPEDRAWCVVTDIDLRSTYVGCSSACAQALIDDELLDAVRATLVDRVDKAGRNA